MRSGRAGDIYRLQFAAFAMEGAWIAPDAKRPRRRFTGAVATRSGDLVSVVLFVLLVLLVLPVLVLAVVVPIVSATILIGALVVIVAIAAATVVVATVVVRTVIVRTVVSNVARA